MLLPARGPLAPQEGVPKLLRQLWRQQAHTGAVHDPQVPTLQAQWWDPEEHHEYRYIWAELRRRKIRY